MQDPPHSAELLDLLASFLRQEVLSQVSGALAFQVRVAANAVDLVRREGRLGPAADLAERERLRALLGRDGELAALNEVLCERIRAREIDLATPGLLEHLRRSMLEKLAVDQPNYSAFLRAREDWSAEPQAT